MWIHIYIIAHTIWVSNDFLVEITAFLKSSICPTHGPSPSAAGRGEIYASISWKKKMRSCDFRKALLLKYKAVPESRQLGHCLPGLIPYAFPLICAIIMMERMAS